MWLCRLYAFRSHFFSLKNQILKQQELEAQKPPVKRKKKLQKKPTMRKELTNILLTPKVPNPCT